ncbi:MAG: hypothetical protein ACP5E2_10150 [Terracidiphilus sp.]
MTTAVSSNLGTGFELGGQASGGRVLSGQAGSGLGPIAAWAGGTWSANPLSAASDDPAAGSASAVPSFRSSWQSAVKACNGAADGSGDSEAETVAPGSAAEGVGTSTPILAGKIGRAVLSAASTTAKVQASVVQAQQTVSQKNAVAGIPPQAGKIPVAARPVQDPMAESASAASDASAARESTAKTGRAASTGLSGRSKKKTPHAASGAQLTAGIVPASFAPPAAALKQTSTLSLADLKGQEAFESNHLSGRESILSGPKAVTEAGISSGSTAIDATARGANGTPALLGHNTDQKQAAQNQTAAEAGANSLDGPSIALSEAPLHGALAARVIPAGEDRSMQPAAGVNANTVSSTAPATGPANNAAAGAAISIDHPALSQTSAHSLAAAPQEPAKAVMERSVARPAPHDSIKTDGKAPGAAPATAFHTASTDAAVVAALRTPAAVHVSADSTANHAQAASSATTSAQDAFSALDAGSSPGNPMWTHAGSHHAEAGFRDPDLGWVGVRADLSAGGVHATLVPSSADAAQALSGHLAGLDAHLAEQHAQVASLAMASPGNGGIGSGAGQQMQQGADRNTQGSPQGNLQTRSQGIAPRRSNDSDFSSAPQSGSHEALSHAGAMRGTRISVVA